MNRYRKFLATPLIACFAALSIGCTDAETSVFVQRVIVPDIEGEGGCTYNPDPSGTALIQGYMDIGLTQSYNAVLAVGNQLVQRGDEDTLKPESNRIQFYEVEVEVFDFQGGLLSAFSVPATGFADPSSGSQPGYGAVGAILVDSAAVAALEGSGAIGQTIVSRVIVKGVSLGGSEVETAPWDFPIVTAQSSQTAVRCTSHVACDDEEPEFCYLGQDAIPSCRQVERLFGFPQTGCL